MELDKHDTPMRVLHVLGGLNFGGAETMVMNLYRNIDRRRIQFDFVIHTPEKCDYEDEILSLGGKIYRFPRFRGYNVFQYIREWKLFFQHHEEYRIIHGHMRSTASIYLSIAKRQGRYTIAHSHSISNGVGLSAFVKNIMQFPLRYIADAFFACSKDAGMWLFGKRGCSNENFHILPNAINFSEYQYNQKKRHDVRAKLELEGRWVIGNIARFHEEKNHSFMIKLVDELRRVDDGVLLVLVGDGSTKEKIQKMAKRRGLEQYVLFMSKTSKIGDLMLAFDAFILPSKHEGLGMVAVEAQFAGLPVFCSMGVPKATNLTGNVQYIDTREIGKWCRELIHSKEWLRGQADVTLFSDYDIYTTTKWIERFYKEAADK